MNATPTNKTGGWIILATLLCALSHPALATGPHATVVRQYRADTGVEIPFTTGTIPTGVGVYFEANVTSDEGRTVKMEVELRQLPATFTSVATHSSSLVSSGTRARTGTATGMAAGNWGWKYRIVDSIGVATAWQPAGNPDFIVQAIATPTISSVSPTQPVATGAAQPFTITGANFITTATVDLEDMTTSEQFYNRTVSSRSGSTGITINPNFGTATVNHSWRVRINNGATSSSWFNFTVVPPTVTPTLSSVSPAQPVATGAVQPFTITGADFTATATVDLEDVTTSQQFYNRTVSSRSGSTGITINPNFGTATVNHSWRVRVNNGSTPSSWFNFTVVPPTLTPTISSVSPAQPVATGAVQPFTITGADFIATATVDLEDVTTSEQFYNRTVSSRSGSTGITINPNFGTATVNHSWRVRVNNGATSSSWFNFTVVPPTVPPTISSVSPAQPVATGAAQPFTITGADFITTATVDLEDVTTSEQFYNRLVSSRSGSTGITVDPNFGTATVNHSWRVRVNNGATSSSWFNFTVVPPTVTPTGRPDPSSAPGIRFSLPLASDSPSHYYFDRNPASGAVLAWNGVTTDGISGGAYDGHRGTDFSGIVRNTPVYAAAGGTLIEKDDGHPDGSLNETTFPNGNFVRINHGNDNTGTPIISVYLHLNAGTVTTKSVGSSIGAGELIGGVGMSGQADGFHVHFETQRGTPPNRIAFDPYAASGETSWWSSGPAATTYAITPNPATVDEGAGTLTFTITRSGGTPAETIYASTLNGVANGYAVNNGDYATDINNLAVSFTSGQTTRTVAVTILNDTAIENNETFGFIVQRNTSDPATTYLAKSTFTITDNDGQPTTYAITPNPATVDEGAGTLTFTITRSGAMPVETIYASTLNGAANGYAVNNGDYATDINNLAVSFSSGQTTRTVAVTINNDTTVENNETFGFIVQRNTSDPVSTYLAKSTFTITDNDVLGTVLSVTPANPPTQPATAGSLNINVNNTGVGTMNYSSTITSGNAWLHINSGASGGNSGTIAISYDANSGGQRVGTIVVTATGAAGTPTIITIAQATSGQQHLAGIKIGVDPGHGGSDTGATGPNLGLTEKSVNLATALALKKYLESEGATVVMTRTTDSTVSLPTRSSLFINSAVDLAISVHHNAGGLNTTMVFIYCDASLATRGSLASHVVQRLGNSTGITISQSPSSTVDTLCGGHSDWLTGLVGVGQANLHMVREPETAGNIPSILAEVSFITDPTEEAKLQSADYLDKNGWAIYAGVADYYGFSPAPRTAPVFTGIGGGGIQPPSSGQFQFQIIAPTMQEVTVQACDDLNNWSDHSTLPLINGQCIFVDPNTSGHTQRYYRLKQP